MQQQPWPQYDDQQQELPLPEAAGGRQRDADGILRQRQRPLKINLDLALVRLALIPQLPFHANACAPLAVAILCHARMCKPSRC